MEIDESKQQVGSIKRYWVWAIALIIFALAGFEFGKSYSQAKSDANSTALQSAENLVKENQSLNEKLNQLVIETDVLRLSLENNKKLLAEAVNKEVELKKEISFYQRVMAPEKTQDGFVIERAEITKNASENNYSIKLMLLQQENIKAVIKGDLAIDLFGSTNGAASKISVNSVVNEPDKALSFAFKYFQVISFAITLPEDFLPDRLEISTDVYKYRKKRGSYSTVINWQDALAEETLILD